MGVGIIIDPCRAALGKNTKRFFYFLDFTVYLTSTFFSNKDRKKYGELTYVRCGWEGKSKPKPLVEDVGEDVGEDEDEDDSDPGGEEVEPPGQPGRNRDQDV